MDEFKQFLPDITGQPASVLFDSISPTYYPPTGGSTKRSGSPPPTHGILPPGKKKRTNNVSIFTLANKWLFFSRQILTISLNDIDNQEIQTIR